LHGHDFCLAALARKGTEVKNLKKTTENSPGCTSDVANEHEKQDLKLYSRDECDKKQKISIGLLTV